MSLLCVQESQLQHVMRFVEMEKHGTAARPMLQSLKKKRSKITALLKKQFSSQPVNMLMAK